MQKIPINSQVLRFLLIVSLGICTKIIDIEHPVRKHYRFIYKLVLLAKIGTGVAKFDKFDNISVVSSLSTPPRSVVMHYFVTTALS